jgi:hypothetical protein
MFCDVTSNGAIRAKKNVPVPIIPHWTVYVDYAQEDSVSNL